MRGRDRNVKIRTLRKNREECGTQSYSEVVWCRAIELVILFATRQARFYDFNVYTEKKRAEKLEYMHENPIKRRLVTHPKDWPWSSWALYAKQKGFLIGMDVGR